MYDFVSVNDELNEIKNAALAAGKHEVRFEKIGNGNISAFKMIYKDASNDEDFKEDFFWRHAMDEFLTKLKALKK
jgi:hypothetical protein